MKKKGFTLIELVVVVAIILLLAATLAPKLRKEVAKARDAKAVAALGATRTAVNVYLADEGTAPAGLFGAADTFIINGTSSDYLEQNVVGYITNTGTDTATATVFQVPIGGQATGTKGAGLIFGGTIDINYTSSDDVIVDFADLASQGTGYSFDTKGNRWASY